MKRQFKPWLSTTKRATSSYVKPMNTKIPRHMALEINVREHKSGEREWTIQRHIQHWVKTHNEDKRNQINTASKI